MVSSTYHARLLSIMYDIAHPIDAIELVGNNYSNSSSSFQAMPFIKIPPIAISHSIIQGDTINPYMFTNFLKPLLQWLDKDFRS